MKRATISPADRFWEFLGTLVALVACVSIAAQVMAEYASPKVSSLSMTNLVGFAIVYIFWAFYGWNYQRAAVWIGNTVAAILQMLLLGICLWKTFQT